MDNLINAVSSSEVVLLVHLNKRILFLGLAVTEIEININFEIKIKKFTNKKLKKKTLKM